MTDRQTYTMTGGVGAMSEWHHGYAAGDILRAVARAFEEAADSRAYLPDFPEFTVVTEWLRATSRLVEWRARRVSPTNHDLVSDICRWLFELGREICGTPVGSSNRLDYLLYGIAYKQCDWIEPLKRRKSWLGPRDGDLASVEYREPDDASREWVEARRLEAVVDDLSDDYGYTVVDGGVS